MPKKIDPHTPAYSALIDWAVKRLSRPLHVIARRLDGLTIWDFVWLAMVAFGVTLNVISLARGLTGSDWSLTGNAISGLILNALTVVLMLILASNRKRRAKELEKMHALGLALSRARAYEIRLAAQVHDNERAIFKATINGETTNP